MDIISARAIVTLGVPEPKVIRKSGILFPFSEAIYLPMCGLSLFLALLCLFQHRENMKRLMNGTENKFGKNK